MSELRQLDETLWEVAPRGEMTVPARVFADARLIEAIEADGALDQLCNVATMPGIVDAALAMPDAHQGYGFPVGGVAATAPPGGVVSPGGVGYDINCGVRLLALPLDAADLPTERRDRLLDELARAVPAGAGREGMVRFPAAALDGVLVDGARALVERGIGTADDLERSESGGRLDGADPDSVSERARERGTGQLGTLGSGNHFLELQRVEQVLEPRAAAAYGLERGRLAVLIHSGSRGFGHQVCTDYVRRMDAELARHGIRLPDRQLSCAPLDSESGRAYVGAMAAAANFAWANRQAIAECVRDAVALAVSPDAARGTRQVYDVAHNVAKRERHHGRDVCVHRKGATRAFPPGSPDVPDAYRDVGQPVFIPGSMGTSSFVLAGRDGAMARSFGTVCHGAGRALSRTAARKRIAGADLRRELEARGIGVRCHSNKGLAEEAPFAYKDVERVIDVVRRAGLAEPVAKLVPLGVVKG